MPKRALGIVVVVVAAAVAIWLLFFRDSEEERVRATIVRAARAMNVIAGENPVMRAARARSELVEVVSKDVAFSVPELGDVGKGRDPLIAAALAASSVFEEADVTVAFTQVTVDPGGNGAGASATVTLSALRGGARERDVRKVSFVLRKDPEWRIAEVTVFPRQVD